MIYVNCLAMRFGLSWMLKELELIRRVWQKTDSRCIWSDPPWRLLKMARNSSCTVGRHRAEKAVKNRRNTCKYCRQLNTSDFENKCGASLKKVEKCTLHWRLVLIANLKLIWLNCIVSKIRTDFGSIISLNFQVQILEIPPNGVWIDKTKMDQIRKKMQSLKYETDGMLEEIANQETIAK